MRYVILSLCVAAHAAAWQPTGSIDELHDYTKLPILRSGVKMASFSSYDRSGGNNDGFSGAYSKLYEKDGNSVIAEMDGPGCIYRFWMTHSVMKEPGLLDRKGEHIRIYLDGSDTPALDIPIEQMFDGSLERFPEPVAGEGIGGYYSYVPIPYRESCKVVIDGLGVRFYQLNYATFPSADGVKSFEMAMTPEESASLKRAVRVWDDPLDALLESSGEKTAVTIDHKPAGKKPAPFVYRFEAEQPQLILGLTFDGLDRTEIDNTEIEFLFSHTSENSIRLPLSYFLGQSFETPPFESLLFGQNGDTYYNRVPIPVSQGCTIKLHSILPIEGGMTIHHQNLVTPLEATGALAVQLNCSEPTAPGVYHSFLQETGRGHVAAAFLVTEGPKGLPYWLEGDDRWTIDGELRIHGTGSEDYFNCGWYALEGRLNGPAAKPTHGFPVYGETDNTMRASAFRNHLSDPVPFENSMNFVIEHGEANNHIANYHTVTYYYTER